mgnify:CR=1 FL=1
MNKKTPKESFQRRAHKKSQSIVFDKYEYYKKSVQSPETDVLFFKNVYKELKGKTPQTLREDFCGTFAISTEWVKLGPKNIAYGVDIDPEPMEYGKKNYLSKLSAEKQKRIKLFESNVLSPNLPSTEVVAALNFSYFIFKNRDLLKSYFTAVYKSLQKNGLFVVDVFGGSQCHGPIEDLIKHKGFTYYWDQKNFDPVNGTAQFEIHFRIGRNKIEKVFTYDWRMWTIPEIRDIMTEVGFKKTHIYWEGTLKNGTGDGIFTRTEKGESCESWIAYIVAEK